MLGTPHPATQQLRQPFDDVEGSDAKAPCVAPRLVTEMVRADRQSITRDQLGLALRYFEECGLLTVASTL